MTSGHRRKARTIAGTAVAAAVLVLGAGSVAAGRTLGGTEAAPADREPTADESRVLREAEQILVRRCMERAGFRYWVEPAPTPRRTFPYVMDDPAWARRYGYTSYRPQDSAAPSPNQQYFASLPAGRRSAATVALNGPRPEGLEARLPNGLRVQHSDRGCVSEARRTLYRDAETWFRVTKVAESLPGFRAGLVTADPDFTDGVNRWAACMRGRGHDYPNPAELHAEFSAARQQLPRPDEIRLAVAEAECAGTSGLAAVARRLDRHYQDLISQQSRPDLEARRRLQSLALPRAHTIVRSR